MANRHFLLQMQYHSTRPHPSHTDFSISDNKLATVTTINDLGVKIDSRLKFNNHINDIVNRAHQRANLILRSFLSRDINNLIRAFKTYIRPLLGYASPVWSPSSIMLIGSVESVQRRFTKRLPGLDRAFLCRSSLSTQTSITRTAPLNHRPDNILQYNTQTYISPHSLNFLNSPSTIHLAVIHSGLKFFSLKITPINIFSHVARF